MNIKLLLNACMKYLIGLLMTGVLVFFPAGGFHYWNGWLFIVLLFVPMLFLGIILFIKAPDLLAKRLQSKEKEIEQKKVVVFTGIIFISGFIIGGLDFRFGWSQLPTWLVIGAAVVLVASYGMYAEVMHENAYLSRTVEVWENQKVIDTGLYGVVRHPMYLATILLFMSIPLVLGSFYAFLIFLFYPILIAKRIRNEEEVLEQGLEGYIQYKQRVKYKVIPFVW